MTELRWIIALSLVVTAAVSGYMVYHLGAAKAQNVPDVYSTRTEKGASGHTITTVAVPVRIAGHTYVCVISEDKSKIQGSSLSSGDNIALAQSCDFSIDRG